LLKALQQAQVEEYKRD